MPLEKLLRKDPYRLFFPLGVLLSWVGVGQWLLFSVQGGAFRPAFHATVQIQAFLGCFVAGFLFTFIPKRTMGLQPASWQLVVAAVTPLLLSFAAWLGAGAVAQALWLVQVVVLLQFVLSRMRTIKNPLPMPPSLVWIPLGLLLGVFGSVLTALQADSPLGGALLHEGVVGALVIGIGALMVPVVTRSEGPAKLTGPRWPQLLLAAIFLGSFVLQTQTALPIRLAYALRLAVVALVLVRGAKLWKRPTQPGLNRRLVWFAAWCLPLGYALLTLWPAQRSAGLHVIFLGAFGTLALSIGQHVVVAHGGRGDWLTGWPLATWGVVALMSTAGLARIAMQLVPAYYLSWMTLAASAFLGAGLCWLWGLAPILTARGADVP